jgi:predicted nucleotidyltransferase
MQLRATLRLDPDAEQRLVERLSRDRFVQVAYLFGSGVRQRLRFDSDLDIGVASSLGPLSPAEMRSVAQQIAEVTGRAADVVDLASASAPVLRAAMVEGRQLFCLDRARLLALQRRLVYETEDFLPYQRRLLDERRRRWIGT